MKRSDYRVFYAVTSRWMDNDVYGHVNNVVYYSWVDTAVNRYLIDNGGLDIRKQSIVGFVVHSQCNYFSPIKYPQEVSCGLRV